MSGQVRVLLYYACNDEAELTALHKQVSALLADVPGLLGSELLRSVDRLGTFVLMSRWSSFSEFQTWEQDPAHPVATSPLRVYQDKSMPKPFGFYEVVAAS